MDANEDIYKKSLGQYITARDGLNMNEVVGTFNGKKIGKPSLEDQNRLMQYGQHWI